MAQREFDFVVFGATGFTGKFVAAELFKISKQRAVKFALSGRNEQKLKEILTWLSKTLGDESALSLPLIIADVKNMDSLAECCKRTNILLNCVGPYRFFGEPVVKACIQEATNYIDITGEPMFIESMAHKYHADALAKNISIISTCGFDSIPADIGTLFTVSQFTQTAVASSIDSFLEVTSGPLGSAGHFATYESAVHGFGSIPELSKLRKITKPAQPLPIVGKRATKKSVFFSKDMGKWSLPFMGSDASVVRRTQQTNYERNKTSPVQYSAFFCVPSFMAVLLFFFFGFIFQTLAKFEFGRNILLKYPKLFTNGCFSHEGPTQEQMDQTSFSMTFVAKGYSTNPQDAKKEPDMKIVTRVSGPEPGYAATPLIMLSCGLSVLDCSQGGLERGVLSPGAAFPPGTKAYQTLLEQLQQRGINFSVISKE